MTAGATTFALCFAVGLVTAALTHSAEPFGRALLAVSIGSLGVAACMVAFVGSSHALGRAAVGPMRGRRVSVVVLLGPFLMSAPPSIAMAALHALQRDSAPPSSWSSVLGHIDRNFLVCLLALLGMAFFREQARRRDARNL